MSDHTGAAQQLCTVPAYGNGIPHHLIDSAHTCTSCRKQMHYIATGRHDESSLINRCIIWCNHTCIILCVLSLMVGSMAKFLFD